MKKNSSWSFCATCAAASQNLGVEDRPSAIAYSGRDIRGVLQYLLDGVRSPLHVGLTGRNAQGLPQSAPALQFDFQLPGKSRAKTNSSGNNNRDEFAINGQWNRTLPQTPPASRAPVLFDGSITNTADHASNTNGSRCTGCAAFERT